MDIAQVCIQAAGLVAVGVGAVKFLDERKGARLASERDLAWKKTQFIAELARSFESEPRNQHALKLIEKDRSALRALLRSNPSDLSEEELENLHCLDCYFDFFDRLSTFVFVTKTLGFEEVMVFSGYLHVLDDDHVRDAVERRGYVDAALLHDAVTSWADAYRVSGGHDRDLEEVMEQSSGGGADSG
ncbi:MAG TPA: hypothetical protein VHI71_04995 [Actinomycetota bacterium]|nr:hypothetical protein [Actinomycetota bacterium]